MNPGRCRAIDDDDRWLNWPRFVRATCNNKCRDITVTGLDRLRSTPRPVIVAFIIISVADETVWLL